MNKDVSSVSVCLTQRDWSLIRLMNRGDSFARRTSGEVELETIMKHSAQAFLMPHRLSEHRSKNLGIYVKNKNKSAQLKIRSDMGAIEHSTKCDVL